MNQKITELQCPECKEKGLKIGHHQMPEEVTLGWNEKHTEYTEGVQVTEVECTKCGFSDCDVNVYD